MADYQGSVPVKSVRDDELKFILVDGASGDVATNKLSIDANGAAKVVAEDFDIRNLAFTTDKVGISDGDDTLAINTDGSINVLVSDIETRKVAYHTAAAVASDATTSLDLVLTDAKLFKGLSVLVGARGACKVVVSYAVDGTTFVNKYVYFQQPALNIGQSISGLSILSTGLQAVKITVTNLDNQASDLYISMEYAEK